MIYSVHAPLPGPVNTRVTSPHIGEGKPLPVELVGVSCYPGEQVTFWVRGEGLWLYSYVPLEWLFCSNDRRQPWPVCPKHTGFTIDLPPVSGMTYGGVACTPLAVIDFLDNNELLWIVTQPGDQNGVKTTAVAVLPHRAFDHVPPAGGLRKCRETWK